MINNGKNLFDEFSLEEKFKFLVRLPDFEANRQELTGDEVNYSGRALLGLNYFGTIKELFESFSPNEKNEFLAKDFSVGNRSCKNFYDFLVEFLTILDAIIKHNDALARENCHLEKVFLFI